MVNIHDQFILGHSQQTPSSVQNRERCARIGPCAYASGAGRTDRYKYIIHVYNYYCTEECIELSSVGLAPNNQKLLVVHDVQV